ncbi:MAG: DegT/DnrJ/EryC1/StrS family aminotransferase [Dissulfurispiraceae bacterium]
MSVLQLNDLTRGETLIGEITSVLAAVAASGWYVLGAECLAFEEEFAVYCGLRFGVGVGNGTDALELALKAAGVRAGDRVVTVANAGMYSSISILAAGAAPVFVDVDDETMLMSPASLMEAPLSGVAAIIVTHLYGRMANMPEILALAAEHGVPVIEDCAQAHGAAFAGRRAGSWGAMGCFSFYPTKNLGAFGDGGAVVTDDESLAAKVRQLRQYGWKEKYRSTLPGGRNSRLDELQAAVLRIKLPYLDRWNQRRREIAKKYNDLINHELVKTPTAADDSNVSHLYVVRCADRRQLQIHLKGRGIASDIHYPVPDYKQPSIEDRFLDSFLPQTEKACRDVLTLPCFPELTDAEVEEVADAVNSWRPLCIL